MKHARAKLNDLLRSVVPGSPVPSARFESAGYIARLRRFNASENYRSDLRRVLALLQPFHGMKVLDFGCGLGEATAVLSELGCAATGVDIGSTTLEVAAREHPAAAFLRMPTLPRDQDAAIALHTLSYVPSSYEAVSAIHDALRPGGRLVLCEPNPLFVFAMLPLNLFNEYVPDENLVYCRGSRSWKRVLTAAGFHDIEIGFHGEFPGLLRVRALRSRLVAVAHKLR